MKKYVKQRSLSIMRRTRICPKIYPRGLCGNCVRRQTNLGKERIYINNGRAFP